MVKIQQHYLECLAQASYTISSAGNAFIIDPRRDIDEYVSFLEKERLTLTGVMITHLHADFVAGHQELARRFNAPLYIGKGAQVAYPHVALNDGVSITIGRAKLVFWETPGHTPGDISTILYDLDNSPTEPKAVFSGDTLFNGDVGRPDLLASFGITKDELARMLYGSVQRLMDLPDETLLYPAHGAGSLCGKNLGDETYSTIGEQRRTNYAVKAKSQQDFIALVTAGQEAAPKYFVIDAVLNKNGVFRTPDDIVRQAEALDAATVNKLVESTDSFQFLDSRIDAELNHGYFPGFVNIGIDGRFALWAGTLLDYQKPIVVLASEGRHEETMTRLARVGLDNVKGYVVGGFAALAQSGMPMASLSHLPAQKVRDKLARDEALLIDVRTENERLNSGYIAESLHVPLDQFTADKVKKLVGTDRSRPIITMCAGGYRSIAAATLARAFGYIDVSDLADGFYGWMNAQLPIKQG